MNKKNTKRYYYENFLSNQNITAKPNINWVADITSIDLPDVEYTAKKQKLQVFLCIDAHTNVIICYAVSLQTLKSTNIIRLLSQAINNRFPLKPKTILTIHTDRGTQFTSQTYYNFTRTYQDYFVPSMSRESTPKDNAVAERYMRTFKGHKIDGINLQDLLQATLVANPKFVRYRSLVKRYVDSLNVTPNGKTFNKKPSEKDSEDSFASMLMAEPNYPNGFSAYFGNDFRIDDIDRYKQQSNELIDRLNVVAAKRAEVVNSTPFDLKDYEDLIALQKIDQSLSEIRLLIHSNAKITQEYIEEALEPTSHKLEIMDKKLDRLLPRPKRIRDIQKLRDPIDSKLLPIFLINAGSKYKLQQDLKNAQLRICYTILYHVGARINEIRHLTEKDIENAISNSQFSLIHYKTKQPYIHVLSNRAIEDLTKLKLDYLVVFNKYKCKYLFGKKKPMHRQSLIRMVNEDLKHTCKSANLPYNIKSHSFRINLISSLLKVATVQDTAEIIGHKNVQTTLSYKRYALSKAEIQDLMQKITEPGSKEPPKT